MDTENDPIDPADILSRVTQVVRLVYPELELIRGTPVSGRFRVPLPPTVARRSVPPAPPRPAQRPPDRQAARNDRGEIIAAVVNLVRSLNDEKPRTKAWLLGEAKKKYPDITVREFNTAYKLAFNRRRGRPSVSYR